MYYCIQGNNTSCVIFDCLACKRFHPVLNWPKQSFDIKISQVLNSPAHNEGKRSKNKTRANISLYTVYMHEKKNYVNVNFENQNILHFSNASKIYLGLIRRH